VVKVVVEMVITMEVAPLVMLIPEVVAAADREHLRIPLGSVLQVVLA